MVAKKKAEETEEVKIPQLKIKTVKVRIVGTSPLITHAWGEKAKRQMREKQQKQAKMAKEAKDPVADFESAKYKDAKGRDCIPSVALKNAMVTAATLVEIHKTKTRMGVFVDGDLLPLKFAKCVMREDMVRVGGMAKTADIRYRPEYQEWSIDVSIQYNSHVFTVEQVVNLLRVAGFSVGLCEWRPEKNGQFGRFDIDMKEAA